MCAGSSWLSSSETMPSKVCSFEGCDKRPVRASRCKEHQKERVCRPEHRWEQSTLARLNQSYPYSTHSTCTSFSIYVRCENAVSYTHLTLPTKRIV